MANMGKRSYMVKAFMKTLVGFTLAFSGFAQADEKSESGWVQTASSQDFVAYLNTQIVRQGGSYVRYWVRKEFSKPQPGSEGPDFVKDLSQYAADCSARSAAFVSVIRYSKAGSVIHRVSWQPNEYKFEVPPSESIEALHIKRVCESH